MKTIEEMLAEFPHDKHFIWISDVRRLLEQAIADREAFAREIIVRAQLDFLLTDQELKWFREGTDANGCPDFMARVMNTKPQQEGGDDEEV